jgi:uncharacterized Zn finger protein
MTSATTPSLDELLRRAGPITAERGLDYFTEGLVSALEVGPSSAQAWVKGSERYQVKLSTSAERLDAHCTCRHSADGNFCKHMVAVGLAWLEALEPDQVEAAADPDLEIRDWLNRQPQAELASLLFDIAMRDNAVHRSLRLKIDLGKRSNDASDGATDWYRAIDEATAVEDFLDWRQASSLGDDLLTLTDALEEMLNPKSAALLIELSEYAIPRVEQTREQVEESCAELEQALQRLNHLHLHACNLANPDPVALAERLFQLEMDENLDSFYNSAKQYREVLGSSGLQHFHRLAQAEWNQAPTLTTKDRSRYNSNRSRITRIMTNLAELDGDLDALVAIKAHDLSAAYHYLNIAQLYQEAGNTDMARQWAERGLAAFPHRTDNRLRDFLAQQYLLCGRDEQALQLTWIQFDEAPSLSSYQKLLGLAQQLQRAPEQRQRALARLTAATEHNPQPRSLRLAIALWEEDLDTAWLLSQQGDHKVELLHELARKLESTRPTDAISLYRRMLEPIIQQTNNQAYQRAVDLIRRMGTLMRAQQLDAAFAT